MNIFKKNPDLELQGKLDELMSENERLSKQMLDYQDTITGFITVRSSYEENEKKLMLKHETEVKQLKQQIELTKNSVVKKVNSELAKIGVSTYMPEEISRDLTDNNSSEAIYKRFETMKIGSKEANEFYNKHQKTIDAFLKKSEK